MSQMGQSQKITKTASMTLEMEAVIHALCWLAERKDSLETQAVILTESVSLLQKVKREPSIPNGYTLCSRLVWVESDRYNAWGTPESRATNKQNS